MVTVRCVIALAMSKGWNLYPMDVYNAFLQGDLDEKVYMEIPEGFKRSGDNKVCRLLKSLYGLKQASRQWNLKFTNALLASGFTQSAHEYSLFSLRKGEELVIISVYVDDLLITGNNTPMISESKESLHKKFKLKDLGELKRKYILELVAEAGLIGAKPAPTP